MDAQQCKENQKQKMYQDDPQGEVFSSYLVIFPVTF